MATRVGAFFQFLTRFRAGGSLFALAAGLPLAFLARPAAAESIGLVMTSFHLGGEFTADGKKECPHGLNPDNRDNFRAQYKTLEEQKEVILRLGSPDMHYRGPNGESDVYSPEAVKDLLPFYDGVASGSPGLNLDGTQDGQATDKTCKHTKFQNEAGDAVDNQLFRVFGCVKALRPQGMYDSFITMEIPQLLANRWLIEISGVDDRVNDSHVDVMIAHGLDEIVSDGNGGFVAGRSQRVDERAASYIQHTTGRIVNGVLETEPMPELRITGSGIVDIGERRFSDARFHLKLTTTGATGFVAAYHDVQRFYRFHAKTLGLHGSSAMVSMPSIYASLLRNADGHKDPATGQCTSISGVYTMDFVNANIVRQSSSKAEVAEAISKGAAKTRQ